jgi:hypothetical protein
MFESQVSCLCDSIAMECHPVSIHSKFTTEMLQNIDFSGYRHPAGADLLMSDNDGGVVVIWSTAGYTYLS